MDGSGPGDQRLIDLLPEPFVLLDAATRRFILANVAADTLGGYPRDRLLTMTPADLLERADGTRLDLSFATLTPGFVTRRDWVIRTSTGRVIPVNVTSAPAELDGRLVVAMIVHDLSAEGPVAMQRTLLALANERLAASLDYEATLRAAVALIVPGLADACAIDLLDPGGEPRRVARATADSDGLTVVVEIAPFGQAVAPGDLPTGDDLAVAADLVTLDLHAYGRALGSVAFARRPPRAWSLEDRSLALALTRRLAQAIDSALHWQTAQRELARRAAILRIARAFAEGEPGGDRVMEVLLGEAMRMLDCDHGGIALWDAQSGALVQVYSNTGRSNGLAVSVETSLSGRAVLTRRLVVSNQYQEEYGRQTPAGRLGSRAGVAAPLLHEGRLIGAISVGTRLPDRQFTADDAEALELLASVAASMLGTLERAQLLTVSATARELAHRLNNDLALAVGAIDIVRQEPSLRADVRALVEDAAVGIERIAEQLTRLQQLVRFQTHQTPVGPALDLDRSTGPGSAEPS